MINCIKHRLKNLFSFSEDVGRLDYFCVWLGSWIFGGGFMLIGVYFDNGNSISQYLPILIIVLIVISLANTSRRLNDLNKHPAYILLLFVPIVQLIFILYLMFTPGRKFKNSNK